MKTANKSNRRLRSKTRSGKFGTTRPNSAAKAQEQSGDIIEMVPRLLGIRRILVPLDFSTSAEKALRYAISFARQFDARVTLVHVRPTTYYPAGMGEFATILPANEPPLDQIEADLKKNAARLVPPGMCERTVVRIGAAYDEICRVAEELAIDVIIIATHGHTGLKHALLGSTAERVVRHAPCPVLVVREHEQEFA
jgi:universal stress protein A